MSVIVKESLANGRLTSRNMDPAFASRLARLQSMAHEVSFASVKSREHVVWGGTVAVDVMGRRVDDVTEA